jgi:uncharacterized delta-60 repeat protein
MRTSRTLSQRSIALRVLGLGSVCTLMLGALGCSATPGIAGTEEVGSTSAAGTISGAPDTTFNGTGDLFSNMEGGEQYNDVKIQPDGKLVAVGYIMHNTLSTPPSGMNLKVARVLPNGTMDTTFGTSGFLSLNIYDESIGHSSAILSNGNILVVGQATHYGTATSSSWKKGFVIELNSAGQLVRSFGSGGVFYLNIGTATDDSAEDIVVQPDGKLLIAGYTTVYGDPPGPNKYSTTRYPIVARLLPTGGYDTSFGSGGIARGKVVWDRYSGNSENTFHRLVLQPNGSIIGVGHGTNPATSSPYNAHKTYSALLERFTSTGAIDATFAGGRIADDYGGLQADYKQAKLLSNGNIVAVGVAAENCQFCYETVVAEYNSVGQAVSTFGTGGKGSYLTNGSDGRSVAIQANGEILVSGRSGAPGGESGGYVMRISSSSGFLDRSFGTAGVVSLPGGVSSLALQADQKIVGAGFRTNSWKPTPNVWSALYRLFP